MSLNRVTLTGTRVSALFADYTTDEIEGRLKKYFKDRAEEFGKRWFRIVK